MAEKIGSLEFDIVGVDNISDVANVAKAKIQGLVDSTVKGGAAMDDTFNKISAEFEKAFGNIELVIGTNKKELQQLQSEYDVLTKKAANAFRAQNDDEYHRLKGIQGALEEQIATRKKLIKEAYQAGDELSKLEDNVAAKVKLNTDEQLKHKKSIVETKKEIEALGIKNIDIKLGDVGDIGKISNDAKLRVQHYFDEFTKGSITGEEAAGKIKTAFESAFNSINTVLETNLAEIKKLEAEYTKLGSEAGKALRSGKDDDYRRILARQDAVKVEIATRNKLVSEASKSNLELGKLEDKVAAKVKITAKSHNTLMTEVRKAREELAKMEAAGQRGTVAYEQLQQKTGKLTSQMRHAQKQATVLAHDQSGFQGIITGLSGVSGAMSAAAGTYGLFAGENENLQKIMTKVQSLMAITIGLQQISQTINKDSAFMLVTVNGLKKWWNEITSKSVVVETAEAVATKAATAAKKGQTGEIIKGTAATEVNTGATVTGTVATKGLAGGFKMVKAAIKSIPGIGWLLAAVTGIVALFTLLNKKQKEAREEQRKFNKSIAEEAAKPVAKVYELSSAYEALGNNFKAKEKFLKDSKKDFTELGIAIDSVVEAENALIRNKDALIASQIAKSKGIVYAKMAEEKATQLIEAQGELALSKKAYETAKRRSEAAPNDVSLMTRYSSAESNMKAWEKYVESIEDNIKQLYKNAMTSESNAAKELEKAGINTAEKYAEGSLKALQEALSLKNEMFEKTGSDAERRKLKKEIDAIQKEIDKIDIRRSKSEDPFLEQLQKQKVVYEQIEKDLKSTDEKVVQSAKDKYDKLKNQGETYLKYLENERNKILSSGKQLNATQKKDIETLNKEISELTQGKGSVLGEYSFTLQKEKIIQKYDKDIADIKNSIGTVDFETGITISEKDVEEAIKFLTEKKNKEIEALMKNFYPELDFDGILNEYADFEQQRILIQKKYDDIRKKMNKKNDADIKAGLPVTFTEANFKGVDTKQAAEMADVNRREIETIIKSSIQLSNIFTNIQSLSKKTAREAIKDVKTISDYVISNGKTYITPELQKYADKIRETPEELALFYETARNLQEEYVKETANPFDDIIFGVNELRNSYKLLEEAEKATTEEARRNATYQAKLSKEKGLEIISGYASKAAAGIKQMTEAMREYAEASGDSELMAQSEAIGALADNISAAAQGLGSGGWIGAVVGGASNLLSQLISSLTSGKAQAVALKKALQEVEIAAKNANTELLLSGENRKTIFGTDVYGKYLDAIEAYRKSEIELEKSLLDYGNETLYGTGKTAWWTGFGIDLFAGNWGLWMSSMGKKENDAIKQYKESIEKGYSDLEAMQVKTKDRSGFAELFGAKDKYTSLKDLYPNLFNSDGSLNVDQAKAFKSSEVLWNTLSSEQQQYFDSILTNADLMEQALEAQKEYLSSLFGGLGDDISNALWQAATEGADAMGMIEDSIDNIVKKWIQQQAYMMYIQPIFDYVDKQMGYYVDLGYTAEEAFSAGVTLLNEKLEGLGENYTKMVNESASKYGIDLSSGLDENMNTLSGAIKGASQESIDLLAGQTNAVRLNQVESMNILRSQLFHLAAISSGIATSNQYLKAIEENTQGNKYQSDPLRAKGVTPSAL